jgi:RNA polymerase sigma-70 factor, ECF subfamily
MEESAVAEVYRQYAAAVWRRCRRILRDEQLAFDLTQEVFLRCLRHHSGLRPGRELLAWLYKVATNLCLNELRDARARHPDDAETAARADIEIPTNETESADRQLTLQILRGLDRQTQELAIYVLVDGMTHAEAASVAGVSERTVRYRLDRFVEHGRKTLGIKQAQEKT